MQQIYFNDSNNNWQRHKKFILLLWYINDISSSHNMLKVTWKKTKIFKQILLYVYHWHNDKNSKAFLECLTYLAYYQITSHVADFKWCTQILTWIKRNLKKCLITHCILKWDRNMIVWRLFLASMKRSTRQQGQEKRHEEDSH